MAYYVVVEGPAIRRTNSGAGTMRRSSVKDEPREDSYYYTEDGRRTAVLSIFIVSEEERLRRCFLCVGLALCLEPGDPCIEELTYEFYSAGDLSKHFRRKYLKNIQEGTI